MKLQKIFFAVIAVLLITASCGKSTDLTDAIPADAAYIIHIDNQSLIDKSRYDIFQNPTVERGINIYKSFLGDKDKAAILDEFLKNPNSIGLDLKKDFYFYTNYKTFGIVMGVNSPDKLKNAILKFLPVREDDIQKEGNIYTLSPEPKITAAWDGDKFVLLADMSSVYNPDAGPVDTKATAMGLLAQGPDKSIKSVKSFAEFAKEKKDISVFYNMDGSEALLNMPAPTIGGVDRLLPMQDMLKEFKGVSMGFYTSFENGEIKATGKYYYDTPETEKRFKESVSDMTGVIKGNHLKYIASDPLFMMTANMKGPGIYRYLTRIGIADMINDELPEGVTSDQIKQLTESVDGDFTFAVSSVKKDVVKMTLKDEIIDEAYEEEITATIPQILLFADVANPDYIISFIKEQMDPKECKEIAPTVFLYTGGNLNIYFGINDNTFFATNIESVYNNLNSSDLKDNYYSDRIKGKMAFFSGNLTSLTPYLEEDRNMSMLVDMINETGEYEMTTTSGDFAADAKIEFKSKDTNSLAVICKQIDKIISNAGGSMGF